MVDALLKKKGMFVQKICWAPKIIENPFQNKIL